MVSGKCPTHLSLRSGVTVNVGVGLSLGLWKGWVGGLWEMSHPFSLRLGLESRLGLGLS